jgi:arylsulfatase A-like enzyme
VLITVDALRPDRLGCYGYNKNTSPTIDRLARQGVVFDNAISQGSITFTSLPSLLTSTYPSTTGIYSVHLKRHAQRLKKRATFSRALRQAGYKTGFFSAHPLTFIHNREQFDTTYIFEKRGSPGVTAPADHIVGEVKKWLASVGNHPFFFWVHFMEPHDVPVPGNLDPQQKAELLPRFLDLYDRAIGVADGQIDALLGHLKKTSADQEPVVVITSDHGEVFNEHGLYFDHGIALWDQLIKVPLVIFGPGLFPQNHRFEGQVQLIDIGPTLCSIAGIPAPSGFEGKSLYPLPGRNPTTRFAFSEHVETKTLEDGTQSYIVSLSVREHPWHLIYSSEDKQETTSLYHLEQDPLEKADLIPAGTAAGKRLKRVLDAWKIRSTRTWISDKAKRNYPDKVRRAMESLGYLQ